MTDYTKLVHDIRAIADELDCKYCGIKGISGGCKSCVLYDAADAIEDLNRLVDLNTERCEGLREQLRKAQEQYEKHLNELEQQLPKRGELKETDMGWDGDTAWVCSVCGEPWTLIDGTPKENNMNFCPNCGAKMEVQE